MTIPREIIDAVRERTDIVELVSQTVTLVRKGTSYMGLCPFHQEKSPSFSVVPTKGIYHCFGCGEGGDVFKFMEKTRGLSFYESLVELGSAVGVEVRDQEQSPTEVQRARARADLYDVCEAAAQHFHRVLMARPEGKPGREYLEQRGITRETIERYRLGFASEAWDGLLNELHRQGIGPDQAVAAGLARRREGRQGAYDIFRGRLIVPIQDPRGRVVAFGGRILPGAPVGTDGREPPKYVNSPESEIYKKSSVLYALFHARPDIQRKGRVIVVEGYFDVLSLHQAGFKEAVASCGTALTPEHVKILRPLSAAVIAQFDSDEAGVRAAVKSMELFVEAGIEPRRLDLGGAKDPDDFIQRRGAAAFEQLLTKSEPLFEVALRRAVGRYGTTPGGLEQVVTELSPLVRRFSATSQAAVVNRIAASFGVPEGAVRERIGSARAAPEAHAGAPAPRWVGTQELNHLLWLLIHFPEPVIPVVATVTNPAIVTTRPSALRAIALLMQRVPLARVLDEVGDLDLVQILRKAAARDGLYTVDRAGQAARQILDRLELNRIQAELSTVEREQAACTAAGDVSRMNELLQRRASLQRERDALRRRKGLGAPGSER